MSESVQDRRKLKKTILQQMKALKAPKNSSAKDSIESLVKQADFYANYLLSHLQTRDKEQDEDGTVITRLIEQPQCLVGGQLKYYQLVGLNWMISLYESGISGILADDMGLGKTIQTISLLAFLFQFKEIRGPHIIIAPNSTIGNWTRELAKWLPSLRTRRLAATKQEREEGLEIIASQQFDVVVTSYEGVRLGLACLKKIKWQYLIIDQAHKIKNEDSQLSQIVRKLHTECKLLLTGTPLQNNLHQLWSLMNFLIPQVFDSSQLFDNWLTNTQEQPQGQVEKRNAQMIGQLHKILRPFMLRRTKAEVQRTLPSKKEIHVYVGLSAVQLKLYRNLLQNRSASEEQKRFYLNLLMQLRKVCCHPYLFPNVQPADAPPVGEHLVSSSGKLIILDKLLQKINKEGNHKVLIFSQMTSVLDILEDYCHLREYPFCRIDGSTDMKDRDSQIEAFMTTDQHFVFLLSTRAGGLGINLTAADIVIIYDSDFNPQMDLQAMDRAHRIGQQKQVRVYRLITENTVEEKIIERQMIKLKWDSLVIQQQRAAQKNKNLSKEEMKEMLQYGASAIFKATESTITDQLIDDLLNRGEERTQALTQHLTDKIKPPADLSNLNMDSINIFDFMQHDEEKRRKDAEALGQITAKDQQPEFRGRREKVKQPKTKVEKKVTLSEHHFYQNRERLRQLLQKEEDFKNNQEIVQECPPLTAGEEQEKQSLLATGFREWSKSDFNSFITACDKWGRHSYEEIATTINKTVDAVISYSNVFWSRLSELSDFEKVLKQIEGGETKLENKKQQLELLEWKKAAYPVIDFNPNIYTKFKSKLYSIDADKFLAQAVYKWGTRHMIKVKEQIRDQHIFRFDHYLRTRSQSDLNKRMASIYRLIDKERQNEINGTEYNRQTNPKRSRVAESQLFPKQSASRKKKKV